MMESQFSAGISMGKCDGTAEGGLKVPKASIDFSKNGALGGPGTFKGRAHKMKDCNSCRILSASPQNMLFGFRNLQECFSEPRQEDFSELVVTLKLKTGDPGFRVAKSGVITHVTKETLEKHECTFRTWQAHAQANPVMQQSECTRQKDELAAAEQQKCEQQRAGDRQQRAAEQLAAATRRPRRRPQSAPARRPSRRSFIQTNITFDVNKEKCHEIFHKGDTLTLLPDAGRPKNFRTDMQQHLKQANQIEKEYSFGLIQDKHAELRLCGKVGIDYIMTAAEFYKNVDPKEELRDTRRQDEWRNNHKK